MPCSSAQDCPPKKYSDAVEEVNETGICVGSSLEPVRVIPTSLLSGDYRLYELFAAGFGIWQWGDGTGHYGNPISPSWYSIDESEGLVTTPDILITPTPPQIYSLTSINTLLGFTWGNANSFSIIDNNKQPTTGNISVSGSSFPATLRFFALAPLETRLCGMFTCY